MCPARSKSSCSESPSSPRSSPLNVPSGSFDLLPITVQGGANFEGNVIPRLVEKPDRLHL